MRWAPLAAALVLREEHFSCPTFAEDFPANEFYKHEAGRWPYLDHPCLMKRRTVAAQMLTKHQCRRILEIGAFKARVIDDEAFAGSPELYVNVDPSRETMRRSTEGTCAVDLPLTVGQFLQRSGDLHFDCLVLLGAYFQHYEAKDDLHALQVFAKGLRLAVLETSQMRDCEGIREFVHIRPGVARADDAAALVAGDQSWQHKVTKRCQDCVSDGLVLNCAAELNGTTTRRFPEGLPADVLLRQIVFLTFDQEA